jgi:hypothetical protein
MRSDQQRRWVVTVEGLPCPARALLLKYLCPRLGFQLVEGNETEPDVHGLARLLHRTQALAKSPVGARLAFSSPWLLELPEGPTWQTLYARVGQELVHRLLSPGHGIRHLAIAVQTEPHEAFDAVLVSEHHKDLAIRELLATQAKLDRDTFGSCSPFPVHTVKVECPAFAADNPVAFARVCAEAYAKCSAALDHGL